MKELPDGWNEAMGKGSSPPNFNFNPGKSLGFYFVDDDLIGAMITKVFLPSSRDSDVLKWLESSGIFVFNVNEKMSLDVWLKKVSDEELGPDSIFFEFPGDAFLDMLMAYFRALEFYEEMCEASDKRYGPENWFLDYYLMPVKQFGEEYQDYSCCVALKSRGKNGEDLS